MDQQRFAAIGQECLCLNARAAARALTRFYERYLAPTGLKMSQFSMLVAVKAHTAATITQLAGTLGLERTTLTRSVRILERDGLVLLAAGQDARSTTVQLTTAGETKLAEALPHWQKAQRAARKRLKGSAAVTLFNTINERFA